MVEKSARMITAMSTITTVTVSSYLHRVMTGRIYNAYYDKTIAFTDGLELLSAMESLFDTLCFPDRFEDDRHFYKKNEKKQDGKTIAKEEHIVNNANEDKATFVIHVHFRRNATWQGTIQWVDKEKQQSFRSTLEMIHLIDEALETESEEPKLQWI